jgi:hypothetical protein
MNRVGEARLLVGGLRIPEEVCGSVGYEELAA